MFAGMHGDRQEILAISAAYDETAHNKRCGIRLLRLWHATITFRGCTRENSGVYCKWLLEVRGETDEEW
jgi:hypothetical protein